MNITEFLEARIAEDEAEAGSGWSTLGDTRWERDNYGRTMLTPSAVLAECAAKRAIIAECRPGTLDDLDSGEDDQPAPMWVARALAAVYKDHPDYQQEWAL
jgi:hypothetical protein